MNTKPYNVLQRPLDTNWSHLNARRDELGFVLENFHEYCCNTFDDEDEQEGVLRNEKFCKCGKANVDHKKVAEGQLPKVHQPSAYCGRIWKTRNSYFRFIQVATCDNEARIVKHFWKYWKIYNRDLVISVVGDEIPLKLLGCFQSKLVQFARDAEAMVLTSGLDEGITRSVNMVFSKMDQSYKQRKVPVIGISPWNLVKNKHEIKANQEVSSRERFKRTVHGEVQTRGDTRLCQNLGYHMFVDFPHTKGYYKESCLNDYTDTAIHYRHRLEKELMQLDEIEEYGEEHRRLSAPVVIVVVGGNESTLTHVDLALKEKIPVLAVKGTDGLAEFIANANSSTLEVDDLMSNFFAYIEVGREFSRDEKAKIQKQLTGLLQNLRNDSKDCFAVCDLDKEGDFNNKILTVLINSSKHQPKRLGRIMSLAVEWNMLKNEQVQEQLTEHLDYTERNVCLYQTLLTAIVSQENRLDWIEQLVGQDLALVDFNSFISINLEQLYERACYDYGMTIWEEIAPRFLWREEKSLDEVKAISKRTVIVRVLQHLFDRYDDDFVETEQELELKIAVYGEMNPRKVLPEKPLNYGHPFKHLLIWAVMFLRLDIAKFAWRMIRQEPLQGAMAMCHLIETMKSQIDDRYTDEKRQLVQSKKMFEDLAIQLLSACNVGDENLTQLLLCSPSTMWGGLSALQMAVGGKATNFMSAQAVQKYMDDIWNGGIFVNVKRMILLQVMPILVATPVMKVRVPYILQKREGLEETYGRRGGSKFFKRTYQKFKLYFNSPRTKFFYHNMTYFLFLGLFVYMVLVDFKKEYVTSVESLCLAWILTLQVDELYTVAAFPSPNWKAMFRDMIGVTSAVGFLNALLFVAGYGVHHIEPDQTFTKIAYSINLVIFQLRIFRAYVVDQTLGPQVVMVKEMTASMFQFLLILLIFIVAYGTSSQALLYTERRPSWTILRDIIYQPYWTVYGEVGLSDLEDDMACTDDPKYCRTEHGLVYIYLGIYILLANVLLLNLLIAIFSNIYNVIYEKTSAIWRYNMYFVTYEYQLKTVFVPPFSILSHMAIFLRFLFCCGCMHQPMSDDIVLTEHEFQSVNRMQNEERKNLLVKEKKETQTSLTIQIQKIVNRLDKIEDLLKSDRLDGPSSSTGMMDKTSIRRSLKGPSKAVLFTRMASRVHMDSSAGDNSTQNAHIDDANDNATSNADPDVTAEDKKLKRIQRQIARKTESGSNEEPDSVDHAAAKTENDIMYTGGVTSQQTTADKQSTLDGQKHQRLQNGVRLDTHIHPKKKNKIEPEYMDLTLGDDQYNKKGRKSNEMLNSLVGEILGTFQYKEPSTTRKKKRKHKKKEEKSDTLHKQLDTTGGAENTTNDSGSELDGNAGKKESKRTTSRRSKKGHGPSSSITEDNTTPASLSHYLSSSDHESKA